MRPDELKIVGLRMFAFVIAAFIGLVFAIEYLQIIDYVYIQDFSEILGIVAITGVAFLMLKTAFNVRGYAWILVTPLVAASALYLHLQYISSVPIWDGQAIVINDDEVLHPFYRRDTKRLLILTGHGHYRIVSGVQGHVSANGVSGSYLFSDEAIVAWKEDRSMREVAQEALKKATEPYLKEKRAVRVALIKDAKKGLFSLVCAETARQMKLDECPLHTLQLFGDRQSDSGTWSDSYTVKEAIDEKAVQAAVNYLVRGHYREGDKERAALLSVVLDDTDGSAEHPYELLLQMRNANGEEAAKLWPALYARKDGACYIIAALVRFENLRDAQREHMRGIAKTTVDPSCASRVLREAHRKGIEITLTEDERLRLRLIVARGSNESLVEKMTADGASIETIERAIYIDLLARGSLNGIQRALVEKDAAFSPEERARIVARIKEIRPEDFQSDRYVTPFAFLERSRLMTDNERQDIFEALKAKAKSDSSIAFEAVRVLHSSRYDEYQQIIELVKIFLAAPPIHSARMIRFIVQNGNERRLRESLIDRVIEGKDIKACRIALYALSQPDEYRRDRFKLSTAKRDALKFCA